MGNDAGKQMHLNTKWSPQELSEFMLAMTEKQRKIVFQKEKACNPDNVMDLLENTVVLYLMNVNVNSIPDAKAQDVSAHLQEYRKKGTIKLQLEPIEKFLLENKMQGKYQETAMSDYSDVIGTWMQQFQSTMDTL